jgi:hypothetical protein
MARHIRNKNMLKQRAQTTKAHKSSPCTYASSPWTIANSGHKPVRPVPITGQAGSTKTGKIGFQNRSGRFHTADYTPKSQKCKRNAKNLLRVTASFPFPWIEGPTAEPPSFCLYVAPVTPLPSSHNIRQWLRGVGMNTVSVLSCGISNQKIS